LLSNGTLITPEKAGALADLGVKGVQVSLEGPEEIHDLIRGSGSFTAALRGIRTLLDAGLSVSLNTTISRLNVDYVTDLVEQAAALGVPRLGFARLVPSGRGQGLLDQMLPAAEVRRVYETILALQVEGLEIVSGDPVAAQLAFAGNTQDRGDIPAGGCAAGVAGLTLLPDGTVSACRRLNIALGNVRQDNLREIWAASPVLEALRDRSRYQGKCGRCPRWAECRGCRAIAYAASQARGPADFLAEDPQCFLAI
jgi:radical SAM protein with 4Fe4S-binding SPASM domain